MPESPPGSSSLLPRHVCHCPGVPPHSEHLLPRRPSRCRHLPSPERCPRSISLTNVFSSLFSARGALCCGEEARPSFLVFVAAPMKGSRQYGLEGGVNRPAHKFKLFLRKYCQTPEPPRLFLEPPNEAASENKLRTSGNC
jgi:hypothetical protein